MMTTRTLRRFATVLALAAIMLGLMAVTARGGGAVWHFDDYHRPGDIAESTTSVAWGHNADLGAPRDGPYFIYLAPMAIELDNWPEISENALLVGIVEVHLGSYRGDDGLTYGPNRAIALFEIPDVPPGDYQVLHCNDPCTTTLGDVIGGWDLRILPGSGGRAPEEIAAEVEASAPNARLVFTESPTSTATNPVISHGASGDDLVSDPGPGEIDSEDAVQFESVWVGAVALIGAALIVGMVRSARGHESTFVNESGFRDVSDHE